MMNGYNIFQKKNKSIVGDVTGRKAQALLDFKMAELNEVYKIFDEAFTKMLLVLLIQNFYIIILKHFMIDI